MDRATATGLIAAIFLNFLSHIHHNYAVLIFLVGIASSVEGGNALAAGIVATIFLLGLLQNKTEGNPLQSVVGTMICFLSLGGSAPKPNTVILNGRLLTFAVVLNVVAIIAFVFARYNKDYDQWSHSLWHAIVYTVLWLLVRVLVTARDPKEEAKIKGSGDTLLPSKRGEKKWRLGTGRWS